MTMPPERLRVGDRLREIGTRILRDGNSVMGLAIATFDENREQGRLSGLLRKYVGKDQAMAAEIEPLIAEMEALMPPELLARNEATRERTAARTAKWEEQRRQEKEEGVISEWRIKSITETLQRNADALADAAALLGERPVILDKKLRKAILAYIDGDSSAAWQIGNRHDDEIQKRYQRTAAKKPKERQVKQVEPALDGNVVPFPTIH